MSQLYDVSFQDVSKKTGLILVYSVNN